MITVLQTSVERTLCVSQGRLGRVWGVGIIRYYRPHSLGRAWAQMSRKTGKRQQTDCGHHEFQGGDIATWGHLTPEQAGAPGWLTNCLCSPSLWELPAGDEMVRPWLWSISRPPSQEMGFLHKAQLGDSIPTSILTLVESCSMSPGEPLTEWRVQRLLLQCFVEMKNGCNINKGY